MEKICITLKGITIETLERAEKCISKLNPSLLDIKNYHFNMGKFYAILDVIRMIDDEVWNEVWSRCHETVGELAGLCRAAEARFRK